jgi:transposase InsO family protein
VSRSGYYVYLRNQGWIKYNDVLVVESKCIHAHSKKSYGSRRMAKALQEKGYKVGRYLARSLMQKNGLVCKQRRRYKVTTKSNPDLKPVDNVLNREFSALEPNTKWVCDITYLWTQEGWLYLAAVIDIYSRRVIGWSLANHMREEITINALLMALSRRKPGAAVLHHSDRGSQYSGSNYRKFLKDYGFNESMSRKGNCWDNAVMERFFGSLKSERTDGIIYKTRNEAKEDVIDYIEMFYNSKRLHSTLGYKSPIDFEIHAN